MQRWFLWVEWAAVVPPNIFAPDVDPRWQPAMERLKAEQQRVEREEIEKLKQKGD
ncbi:MAG: hypothetical protein ACREMA_02225 [Longimicrobiales bacterium]